FHVTGVQTCALPIFAVPGESLPVELAAFDATADGSTVRLTWQTRSETNNAGFAVERAVNHSDAANRETWVEIGWVDGHGTTHERSEERRVGNECRGG